MYIVSNMRNKYNIARLYFLLAEYYFSGYKAWARRVMAEWLKTPCLVVIRDLSSSRMGRYLKACG
jgi:hypothetical protein|tara:strand:- start:413 stop:607 length:195 start_codon:yes stop_codon:yes gene_type:complete